MASRQEGDDDDNSIPPPPSYQRTVPESQRYNPPPGPPSLPPTLTSTYAPPPHPPPPLKFSESGPPTLAEAPPIYEPFSFSTAYERSHYANAPKWHSPPTYNLYHDPNNAVITFHIALPATEAPCACANNLTCSCQRRRPAIWQASSSKHLQGSSKANIDLYRVSPFSASQQLAFNASKDSLMGSTSSLTIRTDRKKDCTRIKKKREVWQYKEYVVSFLAFCKGDWEERLLSFYYGSLQGKTVTWTKHSNRLELTNEEGLPMAILHSGVPARLELTAFAWGRMPSDQIECDFPNCSLQPLFGFVFRCRDVSPKFFGFCHNSLALILSPLQCTEMGNDSFDICEPHLFAECRSHNQSHRFVRQPRPFGQFDDCVQETPLLQAKDMQEERQSHELVIMSLACLLLLDKAQF